MLECGPSTGKPRPTRAAQRVLRWLVDVGSRNPPERIVKWAVAVTLHYSIFVQQVCFQRRSGTTPVCYNAGTKLKSPNEGWNSAVDGVWFRGIHKWLKIPDHCYAVITCDGKGATTIDSKCNLALSLVQFARGKVSSVKFVPDYGETEHQTDYPF